MAELGLTTMAEQVAASLLASVLLILAGLFVTLVRGWASNALIWLSATWAKRGLRPAARRYLDEWLSSWKCELQRDLKRRGYARVSSELYSARRVWTLLAFLTTLRRDAEEAAAVEAAKESPVTIDMQSSPSISGIRAVRAKTSGGHDLMVELSTGDIVLIETKQGDVSGRNLDRIILDIQSMVKSGQLWYDAEVFVIGSTPFRARVVRRFKRG